MEYDRGKDLDWVRENEKELISKYGDCFIVVKDQEVKCFNKRNDFTMNFGIDNYGEDNFLLYHLSSGQFFDLFVKNDSLIADLVDIDFSEEDDEDEEEKNFIF